MINIGGNFLRTRYNGLVFEYLKTMYPEYDWLPWKFEVCPRHYWDNFNNQKKFMEWAEKELKINETSDWYNISTKQIANLGGSYLLARKYKGSPLLLLSSIYPNYNWLPWRFNKVPSGYWNEVKEHRKFLDWVGEQMGLRNKSDWYNVTEKDIVRYGGSSLLSKYQFSLLNILSEVYSDFKWDPSAARSSKSALSKKSQYILKTMLNTMFPQQGAYHI